MSCTLFNKMNDLSKEPYKKCVKKYNKVKGLYNASNYKEALRIIHEIEKISKPPELINAKLTIIMELWKLVKQNIHDGKYDIALENIKTIKAYSNPKELELTEAIIFFYKGDFQKSEQIFTSPKFLNNPIAQLYAGLIFFEKGETIYSQNAWKIANNNNENQLASLGLSLISFENNTHDWKDSYLRNKDHNFQLPKKIQQNSRFSKVLAAIEKKFQKQQRHDPVFDISLSMPSVELKTSFEENMSITNNNIIANFASKKIISTKRPFISLKAILVCPDGVKNIRFLDETPSHKMVLTDCQQGKVRDNQVYISFKNKPLEKISHLDFPNSHRFPVSLDYHFKDVETEHKLIFEVTSKKNEVYKDEIIIKRKKPDIHLISYGNNTFDHFGNLDMAAKDIIDFSHALPIKSHLRITDSNIGKVSGDLRLDDGDILIVAISSHGFIFDESPYIALKETSLKAKDTTEMGYKALSMYKLLRAVFSIPAPKAINPTLIFIDTCHSGAALGIFGKKRHPIVKKIKKMLIDTHAAIFLSTSSLKLSQEGGLYKGEVVKNGRLFFHVIQAIQQGDINGDGLTIKEVKHVISKRQSQDKYFDPMIYVNEDDEDYKILF